MIILHLPLLMAMRKSINVIHAYPDLSLIRLIRIHRLYSRTERKKRKSLCISVILPEFFQFLDSSRRMRVIGKDMILQGNFLVPPVVKESHMGGIKIGACSI